MKYEINKDTFAILPLENNKSRIIEKNNEYIIDDNPYSFMEHSCSYFGSSLEGRFNGSKDMLGSIYKVPVLVEESRNIIFFPTKSPTTETNAWISLNNIEKYENNNSNTLLYFKNGKKLMIDMPFLSIENQILRSTRLESIFRRRKSEEKND